MILRFFRAIVHDGKQAEFQRFFVNKMLPIVRSQPGLVSASVGLPRESSANEFSMVMVWKNLAAVKGFAGDDYQQAVIDPEEKDLLRETHVYHYDLAGDGA